MKRIAIAICLTALALPVVFRLRADDRKANVLLQAGLSKETIQGDLPGAIEQYQKAVKEAGTNHALAVKALLQIAECYQKLGDSQSRKIYEQIIRDYADQKDAAATARTKLASSQTAPAGSGITLRQVWSAGRFSGNDGISPDGRYLSYMDLSSGVDELAIRDLSNGQNRALVKGVKGSFINRSIFSPDGKQVAYEVTTNGGDPTREEQLRIIDVSGSGERTIYRKTRSADKIDYLTPVGWPAGGNILAITNAPSGNPAAAPVGLVWVSVSDGREQTVRTQHRIANLSVAASPDGRFIAYEGAPEGSGNNAIYVVSADGSREFPLVESRWQDHVLGWTPDGSGVLFSSNRTQSMGVWQAAIKNGAVSGTPIMIKDDLGKSFGVSNSAVLWPVGVTSNGSLFYSTGGSASEMYSVDLDPATGKASGKPMPVGPSNDLQNVLPTWSPDSRQLVYHSILVSAPGERSPRLLHIYSPETHSQRDLNPGFEYRGYNVCWFPDSRSLLAWGVSAQGQHGLYKIDSNSGKADMMVSMEMGPAFLSLSKDGRTAYYDEYTPGAGGGQAPSHPGVYSSNLETGEKKLVYAGVASPIVLSPDGRTLAFRTNTNGSAVLMVMPVSGGQPREVFRTQPRNLTGTAYGLAWSSDGRYLYLSHNDFNSPPGLWRIPAEGGDPQDMGIAMQVDTISVRPDGRGIAFNAVPVPHYVTWTIDNIRP
jgi:Tol biopolymer transport system component